MRLMKLTSASEVARSRAYDAFNPLEMMLGPTPPAPSKVTGLVAPIALLIFLCRLYNLGNL